MIAFGSYSAVNDLKEEDGTFKNIGGGIGYRVDNTEAISRINFIMWLGVFIVFIGMPMSLIGLVTINDKTKLKIVQQNQISDDEYTKILKTRYVKGEISKEEFEQMKKDIEGENE